jgi:Zn-dependent protease with chaperone function
MTRTTWLAGRAALAIVLMVSFYALALGVSLGLLWLAYADVTYTKHPNGRLLLFCVVGAGSVLWAILPRRDTFEPPGPRLPPHDQPELFALISDVAKATSQPMPADVYLTNDVNAFVTQRDGIMGFGSRRVMGLGLPLMQALTVDEFTGVLTHEFGHYHSGDVALGPWIHKTQSAMVRTIVHLSESVLRFIFIGYATMFLRVTHAVSRRQEFIADELAARVVGPQAMASGLRKVNIAAFAYQNYWYSELAPVLQAGYRPPVIAGFGQYASSPRLQPLFEAVAKQHEDSAETDPYDTHPSLAERVAALERQPKRPLRDSRPATALLRNVEACERHLFRSLSADLASLEPVEWPRVSDQVYVPMWQARVQQHGALLKTFTILNPPATDAALQTIGRGIVPGETDDAQRRGAAWQLIVAAFALALRPLGWTAETLPGDEVVLRKDTAEFRPYSELGALVGGQTSLDAWRARCAAIGIGDAPLGAGGAPAEGIAHG